ncbi:MAG: hypothetical protein NTZ83_05590 [Candidatus Pacearchaeota archaeon]|nr:hypothetical protein [Candidatus Pacearchaeota archaeon]
MEKNSIIEQTDEGKGNWNRKWFDQTFRGVQEINPEFFYGKEYARVETEDKKYIVTSLTSGGALYEDINPINKHYNHEDNVIGERSKNSKLYILTRIEKIENPDYISQYLFFYNGKQKNFEKEFRNSLEGVTGLTLNNSWRIDFSDFEKEGISAHLNLGYNSLANQTLYLIRGIAQEFFIKKCKYLDSMLMEYNERNKSQLKVEEIIDYNLFPISLLWGATNMGKKTSILMNAYGN